MSGRELSPARQRLATLRAGAHLVVAKATVRSTSLDRLGAWAGTVRSGEPADADRLARFWAGRVERAAMRIPGETKCLPKALALRRLLASEGIASRLVIAIHLTEREQAHAYHAWLERGGAMLVGQCDRAEYRVLLELGEGAG